MNIISMDSEVSSSSILPENFDDFNSRLQVAAVKATKNAQALPNDIGFHRSMDSIFATELEEFSSRVLSLTSKLLSVVGDSDTTKPSRGKGMGKLEDQDDIVDKFHFLIVDVVDRLLEKTDICLDEYLGVVKPPAIAVKPPKQSVKRARPDPFIQHAAHLAKPQLLFKAKEKNNIAVNSGHPYLHEISHISYPARMFQVSLPSAPKSLADTPFTWVSTPRLFENMMVKLRHASELAVDLEHHDYRSYAGFTCLMQISTREEDWIIDTLILREEIEELRTIFTDPSIVKVFHGADSDVVWLQQDFDLYIVNIFDTYHASKALSFPRHGLANLLEMYCDFSSDKRYQLADWRIRPLPKEMVEYARCDTHYLLYIYDNLRNALLDRSRSCSPISSSESSRIPNALMKQVLDRSQETSLKMYEREVYDTEGGTGKNGWEALARKWNKGALIANEPGVGPENLHRGVYRIVHKWRDVVAQEEDESTRYVMPNHYLFRLVEQPPADMSDLLKLFNNSVPPVIRKRTEELLTTIRDFIRKFPSNDNSAVAAMHVNDGGLMIAEEVQHQECTSETSQICPTDGSTTNSWKHAKAGNLSASASSLFSVSNCEEGPVTSYSCTTSPFFGNLSSGIKRPHDPHFRVVVERINSKLAIAPLAPKAIQQVRISVNSEAIVEKQDTDGVLSGMQVEIPFIPAERRNPSQTEESSIVVVGQARHRKRKKTSAKREIGYSVKTADVYPDPSEKSFDFADVPNLLDIDEVSSPADKESSKRHKRSKKNDGTLYDDFSAPPRTRSELKGGYRSRTFK